MWTLSDLILLASLCVLGPVFCDAQCSDSRPQVWLAEATSECNVDSSYCDFFGLDFVCTSGYTIGDSCRGNGDHNVLCASPNKDLPAPTSATTLKVLAYNVWELRYTYYQSGQHERTCRIPQKIFDQHADVDVIVFNEVFMGGCFPFDGISLRDMLAQYGFGHFTKTVGEDKSLLPLPLPPDPGNLPPTAGPDISGVENGGIFIASRWPILAEAEKVFDNHLVSVVSNKGVAYAKIEKDDGSLKKVYHIFGTHLQAGLDDGRGDEIRTLQAREMQLFMEEQNIPTDEPVVYAGDLNTNLYGTSGRWEQMLDVLEANMPEIVGGLNVTFDYENNDVRADPGTGGTWIDYVVYSNQHLMPSDASLESVKYVSAEPFVPCMRASPISQRDEPIKIGPIELPIPIEFGSYRYPYDPKCLDSWNVTDLSDHYAVLGVFDFSKPIEPVPNPTPVPIPEECNDERPQVWLGYATDECDLTRDHCAMFGLEYVCSAAYNTWDNCYVKTGQNVLCAVPEVTLPDPTPATIFKVLSYNVYELRYLYYQSGQYERTCRILPEIFTRHGDLDAIIFNEAFMGGCFAEDGASFRQILEYYDFKYYTGTVGENLVLPPENGGVFVASRWPIVRWDETVYESVIAPSDDAMAAKGAIYAEIHKSVGGLTRKYHVLGTHLQAGDSDRGGNEARVNQTKEMHQLMLDQNIPSNEAVIYGGDLNNDFYTKPEYLQDMLDSLEANLPPTEGSINVTSDKCYNDINYEGDDPVGCARDRNWLTGSWIDYVLYSYSHLQPVSASQESVKYVGDDPFAVCMDDIKIFGGHIYPYDGRCNSSREISDLSDHYAVLGHFDFGMIGHDIPCEDSRPQVWLGDATSECNLDASYCAMFGLDYVCSQAYANSHRCGGVGVTDQNVLCASPDRTLSPATPATTLKVLAYNVWELSYVYYQRGQYERTCRIPQAIFDAHGDVDVIVFNEVFMGGCFAANGLSFRDVLKQYGFGHFTKTVGEDTSLLPLDPEDIALPPNFPPDFTAIENGGVFIASRWPILAEAEKVYDNAVRPSPDALANKGAVYAKIEKDDGSEKRVYHILGTHLQAGFREAANFVGDEVRALQAQEMRLLMEEQNIPTGEPVIYAGDLNTDLYDAYGRWDQMLEVLQASMPGVVGRLNYTYDYEDNDVHRDPAPGGTWLDYVVYSNQHLMPNAASQESVKYVAAEPFEPCMAAIPISSREEPIQIGPITIPIPIQLGEHYYAYQERCRDSWNLTDLSDHYAVLGVLDFSNPISDPLPLPTLPSIPEECTINKRPQVWLGYATNECDLTPEHCEMFGLEYICSARYDTVDRCYVFSGENVLCSVPEIALSDPTPASTFKILTYDVWELRYLYYQNGQHERTCRILPEIFRRHGDLDAIIFNEVFMGGCFADDGASFRQIMDYYGFNYFTGTVGERNLLPPESGGVFVASRWPILSWAETVYESKVTPSDDAFAARGAVYAEIQKSVSGMTRKYHVLGTHLHAGDDARGGDEARLNQTKEMHQLMLEQDIPASEAVVYGGNFNNDIYGKRDQLDAMLEALEAHLPLREGNINVTTDDCYNDITYEGAADPEACAKELNWLPGAWVDYLVYSHAHQMPITATQESVKFVDDSFDVCLDRLKLLRGHIYPYEDDCNSPRTITDLAEHYAVIGRFQYSVDGDVSKSAKTTSSFVAFILSVAVAIVYAGTVYE